MAHRRELPAIRLDGVRASLSAKIDLRGIENRLSKEQLAALMGGIAAVMSANASAVHEDGE